jgi:anti-anti-sigma regulatory factor
MAQLTETVNIGAGLIRASGHLTSQGADLLRGTAESLHGSGHVRIVLDLRDVRRADADGLDVLRGLGESLAARGSELVVRHLPGTV